MAFGSWVVRPLLFVLRGWSFRHFVRGKPRDSLGSLEARLEGLGGGRKDLTRVRSVPKVLWRRHCRVGATSASGPCDLPLSAGHLPPPHPAVAPPEPAGSTGLLRDRGEGGNQRRHWGGLGTGGGSRVPGPEGRRGRGPTVGACGSTRDLGRGPRTCGGAEVGRGSRGPGRGRRRPCSGSARRPCVAGVTLTASATPCPARRAWGWGAAILSAPAADLSAWRAGRLRRPVPARAGFPARLLDRA